MLSMVILMTRLDGLVSFALKAAPSAAGRAPQQYSSKARACILIHDSAQSAPAYSDLSRSQPALTAFNQPSTAASYYCHKAKPPASHQVA
jgi:hypothetical protein